MTVMGAFSFAKSNPGKVEGKGFLHNNAIGSLDKSVVKDYGKNFKYL